MPEFVRAIQHQLFLTLILILDGEAAREAIHLVSGNAAKNTKRGASRESRSWAVRLLALHIGLHIGLLG